MSPRRAPTLLEVAVGKLGVMRGSRVLSYMVAWQITAEAIGHAPTVAEHAEWWHESVRTTYRDLARFRECFPHEIDPTRLMTIAAAAYEREKGVKGLGRLTVDRVGVVL